MELEPRQESDRHQETQVLWSLHTQKGSRPDIWDSERTDCRGAVRGPHSLLLAEQTVPPRDSWRRDLPSRWSYGQGAPARASFGTVVQTLGLWARAIQGGSKRAWKVTE